MFWGQLSESVSVYHGLEIKKSKNILQRSCRGCDKNVSACALSSPISTQRSNPWEVDGAVKSSQSQAQALLMAAMTHDSLLSLTFPHLCPPPSDIIGNMPSFSETLEVPAGKCYLSVRKACVCVCGGGDCKRPLRTSLQFCNYL